MGDGGQTYSPPILASMQAQVESALPLLCLYLYRRGSAVSTLCGVMGLSEDPLLTV